MGAMKPPLICLTLVIAIAAQCPWQRDVPDLQTSCVCSYNLGRELSVQCDNVNWPKLLTTLNKHTLNTQIALLYVHNSSLARLQDRIFTHLRVHSLQLSGCRIRIVEEEAFEGLEDSLKNLNLQDNELTEIPRGSLRHLKNLQSLDLSRNRISAVSSGVFEECDKLTTLKLSDNNLTIEVEGFRGLEGSLKNLNLKGTALSAVPLAVRGLRSLAFLDLSQNSLRELTGGFEGLDSLTALNLERNLLQHLEEEVFVHVKSTLSSLSLLNNLLPDFPLEALRVLRELRVLDIGFNLLTQLPGEALKGNPSLTLLALDGNPLATVPFEALQHLKTTLRGLSLGGRFLHCDCKLRWIVEWIREGLQVTSRERNPQFCGSPLKLRERTLQSLQVEEVCPHKEVGVATVVTADLEELTVAQNTSTTTTQKPSTTSTQKTSTTPKPARTWRSSERPLITKSREVMVKNAFRRESSVIIQWGSESANMLGFRVVYRLFGEKTFKQGPPLEASEREFKIKNVPSQECIIVCVVSLEETIVTPDTVPYRQCREVRTVAGATSNMDKITIAASAAICGTIVVAVIIFIAASRRRAQKLERLQRHHHQHQQQQQHKMAAQLPVNGLPVNCCASAPDPLASLVNMGAYSAPNKDWDQVSAYSAHSQRARVYATDEQGAAPSIDEMRAAHFHGKARSMADGQSQNSFSNRSGRYLTASAFPSNLLASRQDLRHSRQSLAMQSERMSARAPPSHASRRARDPHPQRPGSRYSVAGSTRTLNAYGGGDASDNWTDHDMDIYMARNPTTRNGLVPL